MRMWLGVKPEELCRAHLLGEHREIHGLLVPPASWSSEAWHNKLAGHARLGQIEPAALAVRHAVLVAEMLARGYKHMSKIDPEALEKFNRHCEAAGISSAKVDRRATRFVLAMKCASCCDRMGLQAPYLQEGE